ncbi:hypothetical protein RB628_40615, partial [Streptomyces sp. ADMS]|nr:hypothetical protein [Streptomyces sp. ADMS]
PRFKKSYPQTSNRWIKAKAVRRQHLVADRLAITGSRWSVPGAEALLQLRAIISNGRFTAYWRYHVRQEHTRFYPRHDQADYRLTA